MQKNAIWDVNFFAMNSLKNVASIFKTYYFSFKNANASFTKLIVQNGQDDNR